MDARIPFPEVWDMQKEYDPDWVDNKQSGENLEHLSLEDANEYLSSLPSYGKVPKLKRDFKQSIAARKKKQRQQKQSKQKNRK